MRIHHVQIMVPADRLEEARRYYEGLLGLSPIPRPEPESGRKGIWFACGDRELHLGTQPGPPDPSSRAHVALAVANVADLRARLADAGFEVKEGTPVGGFPRFHTRDPFGNRLEFLQDATD